MEIETLIEKPGNDIFLFKAQQKSSHFPSIWWAKETGKSHTKSHKAFLQSSGRSYSQLACATHQLKKKCIFDIRFVFFIIFNRFLAETNKLAQISHKTIHKFLAGKCDFLYGWLPLYDLYGLYGFPCVKTLTSLLLPSGCTPELVFFFHFQNTKSLVQYFINF